MAAAGRFELKCSRCGREALLTIANLARKRGCGYCGEPYALPAEVERGLEQWRAKGGVERVHPPLLVECPVCMKEGRFTADQAGREARCAFCGCPMRLPEKGGCAEVRPDPERTPRVLVASAVGGACPACAKTSLTAAPPAGTAEGLRARCSVCGAETEMKGLPLAASLGLPSSDSKDPLRRFAWRALEARWRRGGGPPLGAGLGEAWAIRSALAALDAAPSAGAARVSPLSPEVTLEATQWALLCIPAATRSRHGDAVALEVALPGWEATKELTKEIGGTLLGIGIAVAAGLAGGAAVMGRRQDPDEVPASDPSLLLAFGPCGSGSELRVAIRQPSGAVTSAPAPLVERATAAVRQGLPAAASQYLAFQALFGCWTTGSMFYCASGKGICRRIEALGPALSEDIVLHTNMLAHRAPLPLARLTGR